MRILVLTQWYPPEPMAIFGELAETLAESGHDVTVVTGFPNYPTGKIYPGYKLGAPTWEEHAGVRILRVPLFPDHGRSAVKRMMNLGSYSASAAMCAQAMVERPQIIHAIQPPTTCLAAAWLSRLWGVPFVYDIQDMWPETLSATGMVKDGWALRRVGDFCGWVNRTADAIRVISPGFRQNLLSKGVPPEKIYTISNWVDTERYRPEEPDAALKEEFAPSGSFTVVYAGNIGMAQGLETVLVAAGQLALRKEVRLLMFGTRVALPRLREEAVRRGLRNILFLGHCPPEQMNRMYALADALLIHLKPDPLFDITIPHKTLAYLAVGKLIIAAVGGDAAQIVLEADAGVTCPAGDGRVLAPAVLSLYELCPARRAEMGRNGRKTACERFGRRELVGKVETMLAEVLERQREARR